MKSIAPVSISSYNGKQTTKRNDIVAVEEPLNIYFDGLPYCLAMCSPGMEKELALGLCYSEGIICALEDVDTVRHFEDESGSGVDVVRSSQCKAVGISSLSKRFSSSYSVYSVHKICSKQMIDNVCSEVSVRSIDFSTSDLQITEVVRALVKNQRVFDQTGGTHAAGVFNRNLELLAFAEDIGRHNALDKALGRTILDDKLRDVTVIGLTSRLSFEMVHKASRTSAQILVGMSAPTSMGVDLAKKVNLTVVGFAKKNSFNIYTVPERIYTSEYIR